MILPPSPEKELIAYSYDNTIIELTPHSNEAKMFIEAKAPTYGNLQQPRKGKLGRYLILHAGYNQDDIVAYFESFNEANPPPPQVAIPQALITELRQALIDNTPVAWRPDGELAALTEQMENDPDVIRVAIHFITSTGQFIRQEK